MNYLEVQEKGGGVAKSEHSRPVKKKEDEALRGLSLAVGDFIRYWGFRRIHGQIWTQIYLSSVPLCGADLTRKLNVSKALVSPALSELEAFGLIKQTDGDLKTKFYLAQPDVFGVIRKILESREQVLIRKALEQFQKVDRARESLDPERLASLERMMSSAQAALHLVQQLSDENHLATWELLQHEVM